MIINCDNYFGKIFFYVKDLSDDKFLYYHREDGPAIEHKSGFKEWYQYGKRHRVGGPAYDSLLNKEWYINGKLHRLDGPAIEWSSGYKEWHYEGERIDCKSQQEFERLVKLRALW